MIRGVFFDLGWTLEYPQSGDWFLSPLFYSYYPREKLAACLSEPQRHALQQQLRTYLTAHNHIHTLNEEEEIFKTYFRRCVEGMHLEISEQRAAELAHDRVTNYTVYPLLPGTRETLQELKEKGCRIGLISDTWPSFTAQLEAIGLLQLFDSVTVSYELGVLKPDPAMFRDALQKTGLPAEETLFIDDLPANLQAAQKEGMQVLQSLADPSRPADPAYRGIHNPGELPALLQSMQE